MGHAFGGDAGELELCWRRDLDRLDRRAVADKLRAAASRAGGTRALRSLLSQGGGNGSVARLDDHAVIEQVAALVESGQIVAFSKRAGAGTWIERVEVPSQPPPDPVLRAPADTTWIEIELVDEAGEPVPGQRYQITLPDGGLREGRLNYRGLARINDIEQPGDCEIAFPDLDCDAWEAH